MKWGPSQKIDWVGLAAFLILAGIVAICLWWVASADAHACARPTKECERRSKIDRFLNMPYCHTWRCVHDDRWRLRWAHSPQNWRTWTRSTGACESGHDPRAYNPAGPYYGALQFSLSTWRAAGGSGRPDNASIFEQRVRAWRFAARHGTQHWPVCGR